MIKIVQSNNEFISQRLIDNMQNKLGYKFPAEYLYLIKNNGGKCYDPGANLYSYFKYMSIETSVIETMKLIEISRLWNVNFENDTDAFTAHGHMTKSMMPYELWPFAEAENSFALLFDMNDGPNPVYLYMDGFWM